MMKRYIFPLISALLFSCQNVSSLEDKVLIIFDENITSVIEISSNKLTNYINHDYSFVLYVGNNSCSSCHLITNNLNSMIEKSHQHIYHINYSEGNDNYLSCYQQLNLPTINVSSSPAFLFIENGDSKYQFPFDNKYLSSSNIISLFNAYSTNEYLYVSYEESYKENQNYLLLDDNFTYFDDAYDYIKKRKEKVNIIFTDTNPSFFKYQNNECVSLINY